MYGLYSRSGAEQDERAARTDALEGVAAVKGPMSSGAGAARRAVSAAADSASVVAQAVLHPRTAKLRLERGMAALLLAARGGAQYAGSAPRLFTAASEHRQDLRNDLALQTAEDVAAWFLHGPQLDSPRGRR